MAYALEVCYPPYLGSFTVFIWKAQTKKALIIVCIFVSIIFSVLVKGSSSTTSAGAGVSWPGIGRMFTTTGICGRGTPAGIE